MSKRMRLCSLIRVSALYENPAIASHRSVRQPCYDANSTLYDANSTLYDANSTLYDAIRRYTMLYDANSMLYDANSTLYDAIRR